MADYYDRLKELEVLAELDESEAYEVDMSAIAFDSVTGKYALLTASGCSCWDGDYSEEQYDSLAEIEAALSHDNRSYNPSIVGAQSLIEEARAKA